MLCFLPVFFSFVLLLFFVWLFVIAFFVKYLVCANRLTCLGVSQDYLGAGEKKNRGLALAALPTKLQARNILNKPVYPKQ